MPMAINDSVPIHATSRHTGFSNKKRLPLAPIQTEKYWIFAIEKCGSKKSIGNINPYVPFLWIQDHLFIVTYRIWIWQWRHMTAIASQFIDHSVFVWQLVLDNKKNEIIKAPHRLFFVKESLMSCRHLSLKYLKTKRWTIVVTSRSQDIGYLSWHQNWPVA